MNIKLNKRITLQNYTTTKNDIGDLISGWVDFKTVWAGVTNLHGVELFQAMQVQAEKTVKFTVRYNKEINETMRIVFNQQNYNITFIDNIKYGNELMEVQAMVVI